MWPFDRTKRRLKLLQAQIIGVEARLAQLAMAIERIDLINQEVLAAVRPLDHACRELRALEGSTVERLEFVRREILFELQHGMIRHGREKGEDTAWRIIRPEKLQACGEEGLRLNLGCGHIALPGYVNIDARALPSVDIVADVADLQLAVGSVQEIFSAHLLEHFPQEQLKRSLLPHWKSLLRSGAVFRAVVPDAEAMFEALTRAQMSYEDFREVIFGAQDYTGDFHFNMFTPNSLTNLLLDAGFCDVGVVYKARRNGKCFEFAISARV